mmetsp:Transcript_2454/g.3588  ORF Transcript_2454/g.3588 Transcript_2454/m.3588 type:complete len:202 (+) Transcript_2454:115-720(+)|eukprot:CAMPEP_0184491978 /NCGR_PEP_ID=MMETSP0113_2-20130426/21933_1 /TAXON_ID=91329 /ORGANISM="Norrisiella sphaerica, Strain BC52" /LENGTH=201 /DNA_ID=CAMNT_0026876567 /DNA_START=102 /DNA_END=707 /DNA_ORIENTATION=-
MEKLQGSVIEPPKIYFDQKTWIQTKLGNKISKNSLLYGSNKIRVLGKTIVEPGVIIRGDLATVDLGKNCIICENSVIRPPDQRYPGKLVYIPLKIGDYCIIEKNSIIQAAKIADFVHVGQNCVIGKRSMVSSCVKILDNTVLAPNTVCPPFTVFGGSPGKVVGRLPPSFQHYCIDQTVTFYKNFVEEKTPIPSTAKRNSMK